MATIKQEPLLESYESPELNRSTTSLHVLRNSVKQNQQIIEDIKSSIQNKKANLKQIQLSINFQLEKQLNNVKKNLIDKANVREIFSKNIHKDIPNIKRLEEQLEAIRKQISNQKNEIKKVKQQGVDTGKVSIQSTGAQYQQQLTLKQKDYFKLEKEKKTLQLQLSRVQNYFPSKQKQLQLEDWQNKLSIQLKELISKIKEKKSDLKKMEQQDIKITQKTIFLSELVSTTKKSKENKIQSNAQLDNVIVQLNYIMNEKKEIQLQREKQYRNIKKKCEELLLTKSKIQQEIRNIDCSITQRNLNMVKDSERKKRQKQLQQLRNKSQKQHQQKIMQRKQRIEKLWQSRSFRIKEIEQNFEKSKLRSSQEEKIKKPKSKISYPKINKKVVSNDKENHTPASQNSNIENQDYLDENDNFEVASQHQQLEQYQNQNIIGQQQKIQQVSVHDSSLDIKIIQLGMDQSDEYSLELNDSFLGDEVKIKSIQIHHDESAIIGLQATYLNQQNQEVQGYKIISKIKPKKFETLLFQIQPEDLIKKVNIGKNQTNIIKYLQIETKKGQIIAWGLNSESLKYVCQDINQYKGITLKAKLQCDENGGPNSLSLSGIGFQIKLVEQ